MRFGIVRFPGSNCDHDCHRAIQQHLRQESVFVWHQDALPEGLDVVVLPGGFSYGDALRAGSIARFSRVMQDVQQKAQGGLPVLGICNGMQVLVEAGMLPGAMLPNAHGHFVCEDVHLRVDSVATPFTQALAVGRVLTMPVAHGEGRWHVDPAEYRRLDEAGRIVFRYCGPHGEQDSRWTPNGSMGHVAGLRNEQGNVVGLMPHPERACDALLGSVDGLEMFLSVLQGVAVL